MEWGGCVAVGEQRARRAAVSRADRAAATWRTARSCVDAPECSQHTAVAHKHTRSMLCCSSFDDTSNHLALATGRVRRERGLSASPSNHDHHRIPTDRRCQLCAALHCLRACVHVCVCVWVVQRRVCVALFVWFACFVGWLFVWLLPPAVSDAARSEEKPKKKSERGSRCDIPTPAQRSPLTSASDTHTTHPHTHTHNTHTAPLPSLILHLPPSPSDSGSSGAGRPRELARSVVVVQQQQPTAAAVRGTRFPLRPPAVHSPVTARHRHRTRAAPPIHPSPSPSVCSLRSVSE